MEPKITRLLPRSPRSSRSLLCIRFVAVAFRSEKEVCFFLKKGTHFNLFLPCPGSALRSYGWDTLMHVWGLEYFIPTKFHQNPSSGSVVKADYVFPYIYVHYPFLHPNEYIKKSIKFIKPSDLLYKHSST